MGNSNGAAPNDTENVSIPLEDLITERLRQLAPSSTCYIYKVPERMRCLNPNVYTPKLVSIGPLHHGEETLQDMEEHKYRCLQEFLIRTQKNLEHYIKKLRDQEAKLRTYYPETITAKFSSDDFVTIILLDSAFIIELFFNYYFHQVCSRDGKMMLDIWPDLLLLENQLPFFILEDFFDPDKLGGSEKIPFIQLFRKFFQDELVVVGVDYNLNTANSSVEGAHFLDIIRKLSLPPNPSDGKTCDDAATFAPSITELHRAGVRFRVRSTRNLFDIQFDNGILEIPKLRISDRLEPMLRNLVAFEQCCYSDKRIADYLDLLDCFVNTPKDVELLAKYGIVTNILGDSSEACSLINSLSKNVVSNDSDFYFATLYEDLHKHCKKPWNRWMANLRQNYLNTPWAIVSIVAAVFLIVLTVIQTVCSLLSLSSVSTITTGHLSPYPFFHHSA